MGKREIDQLVKSLVEFASSIDVSEQEDVVYRLRRYLGMEPSWPSELPDLIEAFREAVTPPDHKEHLPFGHIVTVLALIDHCYLILTSDYMRQRHQHFVDHLRKKDDEKSRCMAVKMQKMYADRRAPLNDATEKWRDLRCDVLSDEAVMIAEHLYMSRRMAEQPIGPGGMNFS